MALSVGDKLGPYEILAPLGAGGMGEVYRATDTRLHREVAIKTTHEQFSDRFDREARAIASLNHPNICQLYDVGPDYLVMELLEGETLATRLNRGKLPMNETLRYGAQIADALAAAHAKGVIHRDLKPGNVMITKGGIKVVDFGLAKSAGDETLTVGRVVMGTPSYMAPEQSAGRRCDARTDIFALGLVLYEMATGKRALAAQCQPAALDGLPPQFVHLVEKCLIEDPENRWQSAADLKTELEWTATLESRATPTTTGRGRPRSLWVAVTAMLAALMLSTAWLGWIHFHDRTTAYAPVRFQIPFSGVPLPSGAFALSPDGRQLAFAAVGPDGIKRLWIRALDSLEARPLLGTEVAQEVFPPVFWSPDSHFIAFDADGKLKKIDVAGGQVQTICELPGLAVGGSWNKDGMIIFGNDAPGVGLMRVSATGGKASVLTIVDPSRKEGLHVLPSFLPDGRHFLYYRNSRILENSGTYVGSIDADPRKQDSRPLLASVVGMYAPSSDSSAGHLLFLRSGTLLAQPFQAERLQLTGEPVPVAERVGSYLAYGFFSISANGILAYRTRAQDFQLTWLDRQGKAISRMGEPGPYTSLAVSPDGTRAVVSRNNAFPGPAAWNLWLLDLARGTSKRFTSAVGRNDYPVWSPDGSRIVFASSREGGSNSILNLYQKPAGGAQEEGVLLRSGELKFPTSWSRDGRFLLYTVADPNMRKDIWVLSMESDHQRTRLLGTEFNEFQAQFSPDSRWIAYTSDASGGNEVYVRAFPDAKEDFVISKGGGSSPRWRDDGKELYYISPDGKVMAVEVAAGVLFQAGTPKLLFQISGILPEWNVQAGGKRFLVAVPVDQTQAPFTVLLNWTAALRK
jgi:Tol biopolymer transport system component/predicted Ser/Thr protein kinase